MELKIETYRLSMFPFYFLNATVRACFHNLIAFFCVANFFRRFSNLLSAFVIDRLIRLIHPSVTQCALLRLGNVVFAVVE